MRSLPRVAIHAAAALAALTAATPAYVHPHVFAEARLDVDIDSGGNVSALKHVWRFDDVFSSTVLMEFDANQDLVLDETELREVSKTVYESIGEFGYFQLVTLDGKDVAMQTDELFANFEDNQLIILFQSKPREPLKLAGKIDFGVYDPTFYTAIEFVRDDQMAVNGMPANCTRTVIRPDPDEALAQNQQSLTEAFFNDPAGTDMSKIFATRLELTCGG
ncbi:DUF1007 family protein [Arvimicrobium flavum]|uniref:DUF1007 family protein n=1 Tax=Arvimicrobium flavum TaxID=3393320 RepID=UPI00237AA2A1|nr:DUF1007 family protein [Mesorhizobium shangrilense]